MNHPLSVVATVKGTNSYGSKAAREENENGPGHEERLSLFRSHSHRHSRGRLERPNQEAGNELLEAHGKCRHHSEEANFGIARTEGGTPAPSHREVMSLRAWSSSSLIALYLSF